MEKHLRSGIGLGWAAALSLALVGCGPEAELGQELLYAGEDEMSEVSSEIVGGTTERGYPAVVAIADSSGEAFCTGTLIGRRTVLTAGHCWSQGAGFKVLFGTNASSPTNSVDVSDWVLQPRYARSGTAGDDMSLMKLAVPVTNVAPMELDTTELTSADVGASVRHVGFGFSDGIKGTGSGIKRQVLYSVREVRADGTIESGATGKQTCSGDSGGPAFMKRAGSTRERVVATVSRGDSACLYSGYDTRVDMNLGWIQDTLAGWETSGN